ncbi:MAG: hypothetical protein ACI9C9_000987 [Marivirga sp.]|jgi:hypothetical protein
MKKLTTLFVIVLSFTQQACTQQADSREVNTKNGNTLTLANNFGDYWYQGKAELTSYDLTQVRYGEKREGQAVLVYVTEDFSKSKQVKSDKPSANQADVEKVLKLNFTKKFNTGIYPYSIMSSIFSPVYPSDNLHALKLTTSVQEWCGHVFMQFNKDVDNYSVLTRSYFESEGDQNISIPLTWIEDEFWNLIRLDPQSIPQGNVKIIPSSMYLRLKHQPTAAYKASVERDNQGDQTILTIKYPDLNRSLKISYTTVFPHQIQSWEESYPENGQIMTTSGQLDKRLMLDYWNRNSAADSTYRETLGLK